MNNEQKQELKMITSRMKEFAQCIITECDKWKDDETAIYRHGYAQEKIELLNKYLKEGQEMTK